MADRRSTMFILKSFEHGLGIVPNFQMLKKSVRDMNIAIPKTIRDGIHSDQLLEQIELFTKQEGNGFDNAIDAFKKWIVQAISFADKADDDDFESRRGRDTSNTKVTLFGELELVPVHAGRLIAGSPLETYLKSGLPEGFTGWNELNMVLNSLATGIRGLIPDDKRPKRAPKADKPEENATTEATEETTDPAEE